MRSNGARWSFALLAAGSVSVGGVAACVGDDPDTSAPAGSDASTNDAPSSIDDAGVDGADGTVQNRACDLAAPWQAPVLLQSLAGADDARHATLTADERTVFYTSNRSDTTYDGGLGRTFTSTRSSAVSDDFPTPTALGSGVNRPGFDALNPAISQDGTRIVFSSKDELGYYDLFLAKVRGDGVWLAATPLRYATDGGVQVFGSFLSAGGALWMSRSTDGTASDFEIYKAELTAADTWGPALPVGELASAQSDNDPTLSFDGLTLYFGSGRPPSLAKDIWMAKRTSLSTGFSPPERVAELSSPSNDHPSWLSPDGCRIYLTSDRAGGAGSFDIYVATKPK